MVLPQYGSFLMRNTGAYGGWVGTATDVLQLFLTLHRGGEERKVRIHHLGIYRLGGTFLNNLQTSWYVFEHAHSLVNLIHVQHLYDE